MLTKNIIISVVLSVFFLLMITRSTAVSAITISVDPQIKKNLNQGDTFNINVLVEDVTDLRAYHFLFGYDTNILDATQVTVGSFLTGGECTSENNCFSIIDETNGILDVAVTLLNPAVSKSGSGTLLSITFNAKQNIWYGTSFGLYETTLRAPGQQTIQHVKDYFFGDANYNCMLDGVDYGDFAAAWASQIGDYKWDSRFDYNANNVIDGIDYGTYGTNWRKRPCEEVEPEILAGDCNNDCVVDSTDDGILGAAWGTQFPEQGFNIGADFNLDTVIDSTDDAILGANWGRVCEKYETLGIVDSIINFFRNFFGRFLLVMR